MGGASFETCGIWPLASRINHSCLANCSRSFLGDMLILRASEDLDAGTELVFPYVFSDACTSYEEIQQKLKKWGFTCQCALCLDKKSTPMKTIQRRRILYQDLKSALSNDHPEPQIPELQRMLNQIQKAYNAKESGVYQALWYPYLTIARRLKKQRRFSDAAETALRGLETLGYKIVACPPRKDAADQKFEIQRWGQPLPAITKLLHVVFTAYQELAPSLCEVVRQYAKIAYSMIVGQDGTFMLHFQDVWEGPFMDGVRLLQEMCEMDRQGITPTREELQRRDLLPK